VVACSYLTSAYYQKYGTEGGITSTFENSAHGH